MSTFSDWNGPQTGTSANALVKFADAYERMRKELGDHEKNISPSYDPHGAGAYVDNKIKSVADTALASEQAIKQLLKSIAGITKEQLPMTVADIETYFNSKLNDTTLISFVTALAARVTELEAELNKLSLLQFDNVPVGAGIRWYQDVLPEDGTYVWANGQTLYGVNQNFPELAKVWNLTSADNVKVPVEDHTIFKVRRATRHIRPIEHAYIEEAEDTTDTINALATQLSSIQEKLTELSDIVTELSGNP